MTPILHTSKQIVPTVLIINQPAFLECVRPVLVENGRFAIGSVRRRRTSRSLELIIDHWTNSEKRPNGQTMAPMLDWAVMAANSDNVVPVENLVQMVQPRRSHLLVALSVDPTNFGALSVLIHDEGRCYSPDRIQFIGHGLLTLPNAVPGSTSDQNRDHSTESPDSSTKRRILAALRSSRTVGALKRLYGRLSLMHVTIIGAGRGAQELARQLVAAGVRRLTIIDGDTIQPENLDAMPMARSADLGANKAVHLAKVLRRNQPELTVTCVPHSVTSVDGVRVLQGSRSDTVFSFIDNNTGRLAVSRLCQEAEMVHVDLGTLIEWQDDLRTMSADIRLLEPKRGCVACVPRMANLDQVLYELGAPEGSLHRGRRREWNDERAGSLLHLNALACSLGIELWFRWLNSDIRTSHWLRVRWPADSIPEIHEAPVGPEPDCIFCNPE